MEQNIVGPALSKSGSDSTWGGPHHSKGVEAPQATPHFNHCRRRDHNENKNSSVWAMTRSMRCSVGLLTEYVELSRVAAGPTSCVDVVLMRPREKQADRICTVDR